MKQHNKILCISLSPYLSTLHVIIVCFNLE